MPTLHRLIEIEAPALDIWRVLTTRDLVREWAGAFDPDIDVQTTWRRGRPIVWRTQGGERHGVISQVSPENVIIFTYPEDDPRGAHSETWTIQADGRWTRLSVAIGPLDQAGVDALEAPVATALARIRSLAEELAEIRDRRHIGAS